MIYQCKKELVAAFDRTRGGAIGALERSDERFDFVEGVAIERVVHPAPLATIGDDPGVARELRMAASDQGIRQRDAELARQMIVASLSG